MSSRIREALRDIIESSYSTYEKNGKTHYIEDGNGEELYIVPFDFINAGKEALLTLDHDPCIAETAWLVEATEAQKKLFVKMGYLTNMAPTWWTGVNEQIARKNNPGWTQDASEAIRFSRKIDAEKYILGLGYSLDNAWLKATEHQWQ